jgi:hypothetical protein
MGENHEGKKGELLPRQKYAELLTSSSQAVIIVSRLRRNIQHSSIFYEIYRINFRNQKGEVFKNLNLKYKHIRITRILYKE